MAIGFLAQIIDGAFGMGKDSTILIQKK